jgi:hypothetical protein
MGLLRIRGRGVKPPIVGGVAYIPDLLRSSVLNSYEELKAATRSSESIVLITLGIPNRSFMIPTAAESHLCILHRFKSRDGLYLLYTLARLSGPLNGKLVDFGRFAMKSRCHGPISFDFSALRRPNDAI